MKVLLCLICSLSTLIACAQPSRNVFIITTDGLRWQEIFDGADSAILVDTNFVKDTALLKQLYWHKDVEERRKRLMPFFWNTIASNGQLHGNRNFHNKVNVKNFYNISYPGYNEIFTGYADPFIVSNSPVNNKNQNVLDYLNLLPEYVGKVVAFSSWNVFPYIFNMQRGGLPMETGYDISLTDSNLPVKKVSDSIYNKTSTRQDALTFLSAMQYIKQHHPRVVTVNLGETDDHAHAKRYDLYLQQTNNFDKILAELWYFIQTDPFYKNTTTLVITTDHGRGAHPQNWYRHTMAANGSGHIWLALVGNNIESLGEVKTAEKIYQNQFAATIADLLGNKFKPRRKTGKAIVLSTSTGRTDIAGKPH